MAKLDGFIACAAERVIEIGMYTLAVETACEEERVCVRVGSVVTGFPRSL